MPDELSQIIINEQLPDRKAVYKKILKNEVINKTRSITDITRLVKTLSNVKKEILFIL